MADRTTRILLVCANPRGSHALRTGEEDRTLRESIQLSPNREHIEIETLNAATIDDLRRALLRKQFDVVHFSGHGTRRGLVFEDADGRLMLPSSGALAALLGRRQVKVALLNACYSLSVGTITAIGLDFTIASTGPISDPAAIEFARGFYDALGAGSAVPDAYEEGMSAAALKGHDIDAILLGRGEEYVAPAVTARLTEQDVGAGGRTKVLLGVALDVSGSMRGSIRNRGADGLTRFDSVSAALVDVGAQVRDEILRRGGDDQDDFRVFAYGYGLRVGTGFADLASLWRAADSMDLDHEVELRKRRFEEEGRRKAADYRGLASMVESYGLGAFVDSVKRAAMNSAREQIVAEIGGVLLNEARSLGDSTLSAGELARMFKRPSGRSDPQDLLEYVIFGTTPMVAAAGEVKDRFDRMSVIDYDERTLLVVSDGDPTDGDPRPHFAAIRESGVNVVAVFVTDGDVAEHRILAGSPDRAWSAGACLMWDIASPVAEPSVVAQHLLSHGWSIERDAKMFVQVNHSDVHGSLPAWRRAISRRRPHYCCRVDGERRACREICVTEC